MVQVPMQCFTLRSSVLRSSFAGPTIPVTGGRKAYESMAGALGVGGGRGRTTGVAQHSKVLDETGWLGPSEEFLDEQGKTAWKEDSSSSSSNPQPQKEKAPSASSGTAVASGQKELQPGSPTGSTSSYRTAFSSSSAGSSAAGSRSSSPAGRSSSPAGRSAGTAAVATVVPLDSRTAAGADDTQQAVSTAVAAATAAAAARGGAAAGQDSSSSSRGSSAVVRQQRRLSAEGTPTPFGGTDSTIMAGSTAPGSSSSRTGRGVAWGASTGLNRLDSKSAPLPDRLCIPYSPTPPAAYASPYTASQQQPPASPWSDCSVGSSSSSVSGSTAAGGTGQQVVRTSKVSKVMRVLHRISRRSHSPEPRAEDADAPPAEVVEHNRKVRVCELDTLRCTEASSLAAQQLLNAA